MAEYVKGVGEYDHLNQSYPIEIGEGVVITNLDAFAKNVVKSNRGVHRMLSSLVRAIESDPNSAHKGEDNISEILRGLLENYQNIITR